MYCAERLRLQRNPIKQTPPAVGESGRDANVPLQNSVMNSLKGGSKNNLPSLLFFLSFLLLSQTLANSFDRIRQIQASKAKKDSGKRVLVFYFPQYHEIEENNKAWGKGFTDFTNVAKVHRAAHGHPIIRPSERNGFYDLIDEHQRKFQGELARKYGIYGFVYMHYWFSNGPVMDKPLQLMLKDGHPSVHFCLMWANEHWTKRCALSQPKPITSKLRWMSSS